MWLFFSRELQNLATFFAIELLKTPLKRIEILFVVHGFYELVRCLISGYECEVCEREHGNKNAEPESSQRQKSQNRNAGDHQRPVVRCAQIESRLYRSPDAKREQQQQQQQLREYVQYVIKVVLFANTGANPRAVMIELLDTEVANVTVRSSRRSINLLSLPCKSYRI